MLGGSFVGGQPDTKLVPTRPQTGATYTSFINVKYREILIFRNQS